MLTRPGIEPDEELAGSTPFSAVALSTGLNSSQSQCKECEPQLTKLSDLKMISPETVWG